MSLRLFFHFKVLCTKQLYPEQHLSRIFSLNRFFWGGGFTAVRSSIISSTFSTGEDSEVEQFFCRKNRSYLVLFCLIKSLRQIYGPKKAEDGYRHRPKEELYRDQENLETAFRKKEKTEMPWAYGSGRSVQIK